MRRLILAAASAVIACAGGSRDAGDAAETVIDSATASLGQLEGTRHLAELPDGRVAIAQPSVPSVLIADLATGDVDTIGKAGQGPGEYRAPGYVTARNGTLEIFDAMQRRRTSWSLADGRLVATSTIANLPGFTLAFDTLGYLYVEQPSSAGFIVVGQEVDSLGPKDSTWIYRLRPDEPTRDTVAQLYEIGWEVVPLGSSGIARLRPLYATPDVWGVVDDGTLWVARGRENRVDRRSPDGRWTIGTPRPFVPARTTDADRQKVPTFPGGPPPTDTGYRKMPEAKGPFSDAIGAPNGEVWTRLQQEASAPRERYAIFPVSGPSVHTVSLPKGRQVVLITERHIYAMHEDDDGFRVLERFARAGERE